MRSPDAGRLRSAIIDADGQVDAGTGTGTGTGTGMTVHQLDARHIGELTASAGSA